MTLAIDGNMDISVGKECFHLDLMLFLYIQIGFRTVGIVAKGRTETLNLVPPLSQLSNDPAPVASSAYTKPVSHQGSYSSVCGLVAL